MKAAKNTATARRPLVIEAATTVFSRYGYAKTTMGDIARAAGIGRPTLYATFPDKQSIHRAVSEALIKAKLVEIREGLLDKVSVRERLVCACEIWSLEASEMLRANPDVKDLLNFDFPSVRENVAAFEKVLVGILNDHLPNAGRAEAAAELAHMITSAVGGFCDSAHDATELRGLIKTLIDVVAASISTSSE